MAEAPSVESAPISGLFARIYRDILNNRSRLPSMPDVAVRLRAAMQQENYSAATVARVIQADPGTAAYLVRVANSPVYRGVSTVRDLDQAVSRLGLKTTRNLVTAYALRAMFRTRSAVLGAVMRETWQRSAKLAALSSIIAQRCPGFEADRALLAGLLQDIGMLPLIDALEASGDKVESPERIAASLESFCSRVGVVLLRQWEFDAEMVEVARSRKDWKRDTQPDADLADLVLIARLHATVGTPEADRTPAIDAVPAFSKLPLGDVTIDARLALLLEADADVKELMNMLGV